MSWTAADWINHGGEQLADDPALAQRFLGQGICAAPDQAVGYFNLGIGLHQRGRIEAAIRAYRLCLDQPHPPRVQVLNNLAQDLLLAGHWQEGWTLYQQRFSRKPGNYPHFQRLFGPPHREPFQPGHTIVLMSEQGLGDTLQFCRFGLNLQARGFRVILLSQPALVALLQEASGLAEVVDQLDSAQLTDQRVHWLPLLDLPAQLNCPPHAIPHSQGYLQADPMRVAHWRERLQRRAAHRLIALHWQGNPDHEQSLYSRGRSMAFEDWLGLRGLDNVEFVSIQKGSGSEQLDPEAGLPFVAGQAHVSASMDFRDTAAVLANCDLLLSADSGVVHLSGAMGIPTWVALRHVPEWRWGLQGQRSPWYDSVKLIRQPQDGAWQPVVEQIRRALLNTANNATTMG